MASSSLSVSAGIIHHLILKPPRPPPPPPSYYLYLLIKPVVTFSSLALNYKSQQQQQQHQHQTFSSCSSSSSLILQQQQDDAAVAAAAAAVNFKLNLNLNLTVKEKKEVASYAHSLGKKLKIQQVGKSGVTDSLAAAFVENLESNELLKLKIHNSCPGELPDVIKQLEVTTGSVAVGQIGRSVILYRPSLTKMRAEEKKREARRIFDRRGSRLRHIELRVKPAEFRSRSDGTREKRGGKPKWSSRGHRGSSRRELP